MLLLNIRLLLSSPLLSSPPPRPAEYLTATALIPPLRAWLMSPQTIMTLLSDSSASIQYEAFHVFKCFVVNPTRPQALDDLLTQNAPQLLDFLKAFKVSAIGVEQVLAALSEEVPCCPFDLSCSAQLSPPVQAPAGKITHSELETFAEEKVALIHLIEVSRIQP